MHSCGGVLDKASFLEMGHKHIEMKMGDGAKRDVSIRDLFFSFEA